jgi:hypothetical protein
MHELIYKNNKIYIKTDHTNREIRKEQKGKLKPCGRLLSTVGAE